MILIVDENGHNAYNTVQEMLQSALIEASSYLENYMPHKDNMLRQRVLIGEHNGSPQYKWVQGSTHDELNNAIVKAYIASGRIYSFLPTAVPPAQPTPQTNFREYAEYWLATYKTGLKGMSIVDYRHTLDKLLYPAFALMNLQDITMSMVQSFLNEHTFIAKSTLTKCVLTLSQLFKLALKEHLVTENPIDKKLLKINSEVEFEREPLMPEQYADVIAHISSIEQPGDRLFLALIALTGMRRGEVLALRWEDFDFQRGLITVQRNVTYPDNEPVIGTPKSKSGYRQVPLDSRILQYVSSQRDGFLFGGDKPPSKSSFTKRWNRIKRQINLYGASPHVFRHTYATALNNAGVSMKTIQSILGHADIGTTMNIYTHTDTANILDAGAKLAQISSAQSLHKPNNTAQETPPEFEHLFRK